MVKFDITVLDANTNSSTFDVIYWHKFFSKLFFFSSEDMQIAFHVSKADIYFELLVTNFEIWRHSSVMF